MRIVGALRGRVDRWWRSTQVATRYPRVSQGLQIGGTSGELSWILTVRFGAARVLWGRVLRFGSGCASNPIRAQLALSCWAVSVQCGVTFDAR